MAKFLLMGNQDVALTYTPHGLDQLRRMKADGLTSGVRTFVYDNDVMIRTVLDPYAGDKVYIEAGVSPCPTIQYSGYMDTAGAYDSPPTLMYGVRKVPAYAPGTDPVPELPPDTLLGSDRFPKVSVSAQSNYSEFEQFFGIYKPTRFTGIMRKVLQCTFATATWRDSLCYKSMTVNEKTGTFYHFNVNYQWNDSWGVVLGPGKDGSKGEHYFLIQIILNTVQWIKADFCVHKVKVDGADTYAPVLKKVYRTQATVLGTIPALGGDSLAMP